MNWTNEKLASATLRNLGGNGKIKVCYGSQVVELNLKKGAVKILDGSLR